MSNNDYQKKVAYFSMEIAIDQTMKTYSGGLGFLAGSHMRSAYELNQNLVGVTMLWKYGYYDQVRAENSHMEAKFIQKFYSFLEDTGITVDIKVHDGLVKVKAYLLRPEIFGTAPIYFLSTDLPENDYVSQTICHHLYDSNLSTRIAQEIILGAGGAKVLEQVGDIDIYHMNEAHPLPLTFYLYSKHRDFEKLRSQVVFTTHTPEKAGNSEYDFNLLFKMNYFSGLEPEEVYQISGERGEKMGCTPAGLRMSKKANAVSQLHKEVARDMWKDVVDPRHILGITNSQNAKYWQDYKLARHLKSGDDEALLARKKELKKRLFHEVALQEGDLFDENVLTIVWARRFAAYKRPELITRDLYQFLDLLKDSEYPVQIIWAGKPYPKDHGAVEIFNHLIDITYTHKNCAILVGYELDLSAKIKKGADIWLNTPRITREASGTSGMTASMNGALNLSINDGWIPEYAKEGENCFIIPSRTDFNSIEEQDDADFDALMKVLKEQVLPTYYKNPKKWLEMMKASMQDIFPFFESGRMADQYYRELYNAEVKEDLVIKK
ncbi:alpha-glucan family phosphorylase [Algoriphagus sediminis]|uniref:Alpha-glucan family phosphorylase n=1 Tax=Algoriphagus sediminis TaxID=3057113 RepID=A0ABT7YD27_9BACT|nr:alpha-glucan family phosphorylase [Algoriphagus sediminis]MDN3204428.1 alpha-glucan family phosphorylase [Algoriphagus sediminis]